ncbi:GntR family transcriptional regulator [Actinomadura sp. NPDC047616]|uniref:GntR family transcriptional regulator n=1 Tax=Actinomadura sp. NPDC047616 TaxID=3155914 RepID=UPI0033C25ADB
MPGRYEDIAADLRRRIESGEYPPGTRLPGYRELTEMLGVSKDVIRRAMSTLEAEGIIEIQHRRGITVRSQGERRRRRGAEIMRDPRRGYIFPAATAPDEPWKAHGTPKRSMEPIPEDLAALLGVPAGTEVLRRRRVMSPAEDDTPFDITDTWIAPHAVADAPQVGEVSTGPGGYLDRLEEAGHGPISWDERTRARMPTSEEARLLRMPRTGMPVLELVRIGRSARTGDPLEVTAVVIPADRVEVWSSLTRHETAAWPVAPVTPAV